MLPLSRHVSALLLFTTLSLQMSAETAEEALANALERGDAAGVKAAFDAGADVQFSRRSFLAFAAQKPNPEIVRVLLEKHARLDLPTPDRVMPLEAAVAPNDSAARLEVVNLLVAAGALEKSPDRGGRALFLACRNNHLDIARRLAQAGAKVGALLEQPPALHQILARPIVDESELEPVVRLLLEAGADPAPKDGKGRTAGDLAADLGLPQLLERLEPGNPGRRDLAVVRQRALDRQLVVAVARHHSSRIRWAAPRPDQPGSQLETIKRSLDSGANPRVKFKLWGEWECSALGALLDSSTAPPTEADPVVLDLLLSRSASWDDLGRNRDRRFREAIGLPALAEIIVKHGLKPDQAVLLGADVRDPRQATIMTTALHVAAASGNVPLTTTLLEGGGHLEALDPAGYTPLARAVASGREATTELLLKRGANHAVTTSAGLTLADLAAQANNLGRVKLWDAKGTYRELVRAYAPPANSRWSGAWQTGSKDHPSAVTLEADGSGSFFGGNVMWTETQHGIRLRMGSGSTIREINLVADPQGSLRPAGNNSGGYGLILWRPGQPPAEKPPNALASPAQLTAALDEQIAALDSGRSDSFSTDSALKLDGFPDRVWRERRWKRIMIQSGDLRVVPAGLGGMPELAEFSISNQSDLRIEPGALDLPALATLRLERIGVKDLPLRLDLMPALREIQIYDSGLTSLPGGWAAARNLTWCGIANSRIRALPEDIGAAPALKRLGVTGNQLTVLPESLAGSVIEELYLADNRFSSIPSVITRMPRLRALDLSSNRLPSLNPAALPSGLKHLNLSGNQLAIVPDLRHCTGLEAVDLSSNLITELPADDSWLPASVVELNLRSNQLTKMPDWLSTRSVRRLNIDANNWPDDEARRVSRDAEESWRKSPGRKHP